MAHDPAAPDLVDQAARNLLAEARRTMTDHPEVDLLLAYQESRLESAEADRVRQHLAHCQDCAREVLSLGVFDEPATSGFPTDAENLASWERYQQRLTQQELSQQKLAQETSEQAQPDREKPAQEPGFGPRHARYGPWRLGNPWLLAASILFAVTGLAAWWSAFQTRPAEPALSPTAAAPQLLAFRLRPAGEPRKRDAAVVESIDVPATADTLISTLLIADQTPFPNYRIEIRDSAGEPVIRQRGVPRQKNGSFLLQLARSKLPDGTYTLVLSGTDGKREETLAIYDFALRTK